MKIPKVQPIKIGGFELTATGMNVKGRPSFEEYQGAGDFIQRAHRAGKVDDVGFGLPQIVSASDEAGKVHEMRA